MQAIQDSVGSIIISIFIISLCSSIYYSVKFRRERKPDHRGIMQAKQNMSMGIMLIMLSLHQFFIVSGSTVSIVIGALFLLLGFFNLFAGIRNHSIFRARMTKIDQ